MYSGSTPFPPFAVLPPAATQGDRYIWSVIAKYRPGPAAIAMVDRAQAGLAPHIRAWAGQCLVSLFRSGSFAKGTTIRGDSDLDLLVSLRSDTQGTMAELYGSLGRFLTTRRYTVRHQNVSVRVVSAGLNVDVTPAKRQPGIGYDHTLYRSKARTWTKTNVHRHIQLIKTCRRIPEIRAMKIWRTVHGLDFPSFHLELVVLEALRGHAFGRLEANVPSTLEFLSNRLIHCRIEDPSNSANILSDELTAAEKQAIADQAGRSLAERYWERILW